MEVFLIGGTRNVGHHLAIALVERGHRVTTFNRGLTPDELENRVKRIHGDRTVPGDLDRAIYGRSFDAVVDTIAMRTADTVGAIEALDGRVDHYVHFSTGQVYLVRDGCPTPSREEDYEGPVVLAPPEDSWELREWRYGVEKRECEDALAEAWEVRQFPATRLRLPMIHGERDPSGRIHAYMLRLLDGGPLLVPEEPGPVLKHIYQADVVAAVIRILESGTGKGRAYNVAQDDAWRFDEFLDHLAATLEVEYTLVLRPRAELASAGVFPACSPLSNPWMSVLDNERAREELGLRFTPFGEYLPRLVRHCLETKPAAPEGYSAQRERERALAAK